MPEVIQKGGEALQFVAVIDLPSVATADGFIEAQLQSELIELFNRSTSGRILKAEGCI